MSRHRRLDLLFVKQTAPRRPNLGRALNYEYGGEGSIDDVLNRVQSVHDDDLTVLAEFQYAGFAMPVVIQLPELGIDFCMKTLNAILFVSLQLGWLSELSAEAKFEYEVTFGSKTHKYLVVKSNCPAFEWEKGGEPKLSVGAAVNLARLEARETYRLRTDRAVLRVELRSLADGGGRWFYCVTFGFPEDAEGAGMFAPITIVVFMDGTVLKPSSVEPAKAK